MSFASTSFSPSTNASMSSSTQPNCLCASDAVDVCCSSSIHFVVYTISLSKFFPHAVTPSRAMLLRNSSLEVTCVSGTVN